MRKSGQLNAALEMAREEFAASPDRWSASALFWVYYSIAKSDGFLGLPLWAVGDGLLDLRRFLEGDEVVSEKLPPLVTRLAGVCTRNLRSGSAIPEEELNFLKKAAAQFPDDVFVTRALAWAYNRAGRGEDAVALFRGILKKKNDAYLWGELYDFVKDDKIREAALCKALLLQPKPEFTGNLRLKLACVLIRKGDYAAAAYELRLYEETYRRNGWALAAEYYRTMKFIPSGTVPAETGRRYYSAMAESAGDFIFQELPKTVCVPVTLLKRKSRNGKGAKTEIVLVSENGRVLYAPLSLARVSPEKCMEYSFSVQSVNQPKGGRRIVSCVKSEESPVWRCDIKVIGGKVIFRTDRNGNRYGMLEGCFLPPQIAARISSDSETVSVVALLKKGKWKAVHLLPQVQNDGR